MKRSAIALDEKMDLPVLASYPRSGQHYLCALILERLGADAPKAADMKDDDARHAIDGFVPFVKCRCLSGEPRYGFVRTHDGPGPWFAGPAVLLVREYAPVLESWVAYQGIGRPDIEAVMSGRKRGPRWIGPPTDWAGFNAAWADAGALTVTYEGLLDDPWPEVDRIIEHLGLKHGADGDGEAAR